MCATIVNRAMTERMAAAPRRARPTTLGQISYDEGSTEAQTEGQALLETESILGDAIQKETVVVREAMTQVLETSS